MIETDFLVTFLIASVSLTLSPGPDIICVLTQSLSQGKLAGIALSLGLVSGIIVHTSLIAVGVSAFFVNSPKAFFTIKILGVAYLFWIAFKIFKTPHHISLDKVKSEKSNIKLVQQGFLMNVLNPKVTIFFLAFFPGFVNPNKSNTLYQIFILGFLFMLQAFLIFTSVSLLSSKLSSSIRTNIHFSLCLKWIQIIVYFALGIYILI